jgi:hypothetical protein
MTLFVLSLIIFLLAMAALGIGVMLGRGPLRSSCGGDEVVKLCRICARKERW